MDWIRVAVTTLGLGIGSYALLTARKASAAPSKPGPAPLTPQAAKPPQGASLPPGGSVYATDPSDAALHSSGWVPFRGVMVTALPLIDTRTGLFARLRYRDALKVADAMGAELMTTALVDQINLEGFLLQPCPLVQTAYDAAHMATRPYAEKEDACIRAQLGAWDGVTPVGNVGKDWIRGAKPGMALNYGWKDPKTGKYIQTLGTKHNDQHTDYSQLTRLVKGA